MGFLLPEDFYLLQLFAFGFGHPFPYKNDGKATHVPVEPKKKTSVEALQQVGIVHHHGEGLAYQKVRYPLSVEKQQDTGP